MYKGTIWAGYWRALAIAAARCPAVGFSAVPLMHNPSAAMASSVVGPMAANCGDVGEIFQGRVDFPQFPAWRLKKDRTFIWGSCSPESLRTTSKQNLTPDGLKKAMLAGAPCEGRAWWTTGTTHSTPWKAPGVGVPALWNSSWGFSSDLDAQLFDRQSGSLGGLLETTKPTSLMRKGKAISSF